MERFASLAAAIRDAYPAGKAQIYRGLNLVLTSSQERRRCAPQHTCPLIPMGLWSVSEERVHLKANAC
ncbi:MAG TPA: hypothetical protein DHU96_02355 [Actinobacteria bacterium]|nr:hypothetical protein [Actinomycetota bacterium]